MHISPVRLEEYVRCDRHLWPLKSRPYNPAVECVGVYRDKELDLIILQLLLDTNIDQRLVTRAAFEAATITRT